jgi:fermentation-respiration switch protein FrsA (DUF1100 family)
MSLPRVGLGLIVAYVVLVLLAWLFQERIAFPAPRAALPDPLRTVGRGERIELVMKDGTRLAGWFLPAVHGTRPVAAVLWFYGNGETIGAIWPVLRDFQPPGAALLVVDYPGYGASAGHATEAGLNEAADLAFAALAARPEVDPARIVVYGRSLGSAFATRIAAAHPVAGLVLESPFTSAREMSRRHYGLFPQFILRLRLDNVGTIPLVRCPVLVFHGTADRLVSPEMGRAVAAAAPATDGRGVELVLIEGAGHNDTYDVGGARYARKLADFVAGAGVKSR